MKTKKNVPAYVESIQVKLKEPRDFNTDKKYWYLHDVSGLPFGFVRSFYAMHVNDSFTIYGKHLATEKAVAIKLSTKSRIGELNYIKISPSEFQACVEMTFPPAVPTTVS